MKERKWVKVTEDPRLGFEDNRRRLVYTTTDNRFVLCRGGCWDFEFRWQLYYVPRREQKRVAEQLADGQFVVPEAWSVGVWYANAKPPIKQVESHLLKLFDDQLDRLVESYN